MGDDLGGEKDRIKRKIETDEALAKSKLNGGLEGPPEERKCESCAHLEFSFEDLEKEWCQFSEKLEPCDKYFPIDKLDACFED